ncbi:FAD-binding protein [Sphingomonas sp. BIUV-7]|uniref:FAD-binding protein n=1 Tax=Sphingomonas natans TaxID=3063330 RepID=A0ABT8Y8R7_9SPHN|nr:FAD-binding protein [Sphingomonas sp. BIUV-7]MDO6414714.1 FAD-binding protein [Sphingomonas sp. BIUV-7]
MCVHRPNDEQALGALISDAAAAGRKLELRAGGSKAQIGWRAGIADIVDMSAFAGIVDYDPAELVLTVRPATPLAEVEALVAADRQMLGFEPFDHGPIFGAQSGHATIGGVIAAGVAGSARPFRGGARDHLLGFRAISGRGEAFVGGAEVVKNVTGYDLPKIIAGSWGRLAALTELTVKVLPVPRETSSFAVVGLDPGRAYRAMARVQGSTADVSGAAFIPMQAGAPSRTVFRLQGARPSIDARTETLRAALADFGATDEIDGDVWETMRTLAPLREQAVLWRVSLPPKSFAAFVERLDRPWLADWGGGLVWLGGGDAEPVRGAAELLDGKAMLIRGGGAPTFHPQPAMLARLEERVRRAFDPAGIFETGRFDAH